MKSSLSACPKRAWRTIAWRQGTCENVVLALRSRARSCCASRLGAHQVRPEEWLLIEWPEGKEKPTKFWLSTLPKNIAFHKLVDLTKLRWRIERDYQELKQEVGLGDFEGRGWRGFHHHATLCIAAYGFLVSERETIPPQDLVAPLGSKNLPFPLVTDPEAPPVRPNVTSRTRSRRHADD